MRRLFFALACLCALNTLPACAGAIPFITKVIAAVGEAGFWIDTIESFAEGFFVRSPNPELEAKVKEAVTRARAAAALIESGLNSAKGFSEEDADAAFAELRKAYDELLVLVGPLGVEAKPLQGVEGTTRFGLSPGGRRLTVPPSSELVPRD